jgi:hypothetical protein
VILLVFIFGSNIYCQIPEKVEGGYKQCTIKTLKYKDGKLQKNSTKKVITYDKNGYKIEKVLKDNKKTTQEIKQRIANYQEINGQRVPVLEFYSNPSIELFMDTDIISQTNSMVNNCSLQISSIPEVIKKDDAGNKIEEKWFTYNGVDSSFWTKLYKYDKMSNIIEEVVFEDDVFYYKITYQKDYQGNSLDEIMYDSDSTICSRSTYKYDTNIIVADWLSYIYKNDENNYEWEDFSHEPIPWNLIEEKKYTSNGTLKYMVIYNYDKGSNKIVETLYNSDSTIQVERTYINNEIINQSEFSLNGRIIRKCCYHKDDYSWGDKKWNLIEDIKYCDDGSMQSYKYNWSHSRHNNLIEECVYNSDGSYKYKYVFNYDWDGNVIERTSYDKNHIPIEKIEYTYSK